MTWLSVQWPSVGQRVKRGVEEEGRDGLACWHISVVVIWHRFCHSSSRRPPSLLQLPFVRSNLPRDWLRTTVAGKGGGGYSAVRSLPVFPCHLCMCSRGSVWGILKYFCYGLCFNQTSCLSFSADLSHPPLCCSDWLRDTEERESEKDREEKRRVRRCYSLSTLTPKTAKENASAPLTPLRPAPHSRLIQLSHPLSQDPI